jgi:Mg/Co/Ni transporter MgtE
MIIGTTSYINKATINTRIRELTHDELYELINELDDDNEAATVNLMSKTRLIEGLNEQINDLVHELQHHDQNRKREVNDGKK